MIVKVNINKHLLKLLLIFLCLALASAFSSAALQVGLVLLHSQGSHTCWSLLVLHWQTHPGQGLRLTFPKEWSIPGDIANQTVTTSPCKMETGKQQEGCSPTDPSVRDEFKSTSFQRLSNTEQLYMRFQRAQGSVPTKGHHPHCWQERSTGD